ncbi:MAG: hypothetical protein ABI626_03150 [Sphingomicrobium sp.]
MRADTVKREQSAKVERNQRQQQARQQQQRTDRVAQSNARNNGQANARNNIQRNKQAQQDRQAARVANNVNRDQLRADRIQNREDRRFERSGPPAAGRVQVANIDGKRRVRPIAAVGQKVNLAARNDNRDWYNGYAENRFRAFHDTSPNYIYNYNSNDGYLYQLSRADNRVIGSYPLLGGAFGTGQPVPIGFDNYNVPYGYQSRYYDTPDYYYRYGDGAIYRVDRSSQLIQAVAALLTGQSLGVGRQLPLGYDVYNVPYGYRDQYRDTSSMWYRYDDGNIYGVDPNSRMIQNVYPVSYGYNVGYPAPSYGYGGPSPYGYGGYGSYDAGYNNYGGYGGYGAYNGYGVPYGYRDLYSAAPGYNYQYANGGIYQVDPSTQLVQALVALVTGTNLGVGQQLPLGYDTYNVPYAYRSQYADNANSWYRYDDGYIYGVDPRTRIIQSAVPLDYQTYSVGYPMPAYAGYDVPRSYQGLYNVEPNYDYRYLNGGIYQVDPNTRMVQGVAALLTGNSFGVGQAMPAGYDVYNVPMAYRGDYYDTPNSWYRYSDGNIYRIDPQTRVIQAVIDAVS